MILRIAALVCFANCLFANTYYISKHGNDAQDGTNLDRAWHTATRVNRIKLVSGDSILFEGGATFKGNIVLNPPDEASKISAIRIGSFGPGIATLFAGDRSGVLCTNISNLTVENLNIEGSGRVTNSGFGFLCDNTSLTANLNGLTLRLVQIRGFGKYGIQVTGKEHGFNHVRIEDCMVHDNLKGGIEVAGRLSWEASHYAHSDVMVRRCQAYDNSGDPLFGQSHSGSGIVLYQVNGGLIESCAAWNNGALCPARGGGPVGIWACAARGVTIQNCESFANKTRGMDGGGFDIDGGCEGCVLQNNYSHDNIGPGLMVYTYPYGNYTDRGNVVRFNVSVNDAVKSERYAGLWVRADGRKMTNVLIYNNTVITKGKYAAFVYGHDVQATLQNNLFITNPNGTPIAIEGGHSSIQLVNNALWRNGAPFRAIWNEKDYNDPTAWQAASGERNRNWYTDPKMNPIDSTTLNGLSNLARLRPGSAEILTNGFAITTADIPASSADILNNQFHGPMRPIGAIGLP